MLLVLTVLGPGCSTTEGSLKGALEPFAPKGITDGARPAVRHALLVGIDSFEDERFSDLRYAGRDASALAAALKGFEDVVVLTGPATSRAAILEALDALARRVTSPDDTVLVYFSTHGSLDRRPGGDLERFMVAADTRLHLLASTGIAVNDLIAALDRMTSRRSVLIMAACHSGGGKSRVSDDLARALAALKSPPLAPLDSVSEAAFVLSASAFGEAARENDRLEHDVYTYFLLQALEAGDRDGDGAITASEAHDFARERTYVFTEGAQRPTAESAVLGTDPIVLAGSPVRTGRPVVYSYAPSAQGIMVLIDGQTKGVLPGGIAIDPGPHQLELRDHAAGESIYSGEIDVRPGERAELSELLPPPLETAIGVGPGLFAPFSGGVRKLYFPVTFGVRLSARLAHLLFRRSVVAVTTDISFASGRVPAVEESLPFRLYAVRPGARLGYDFRLLPALSLETTAGAGGMFAFRSFESSTFSGRETLRGFYASAQVALRWEVNDWLVLGIDLEPGALWASLGGDSGPHGFLAATLGASARF
jgi:hypothetical protein